ncbi:hypothetical protein [Pontibacter virosus]|uniref:Uncharacterized protein n=1 Tax=Pontibacter virosus TaxID=1765052 RepID=A0A2U1B6L1_9BACT|nr:hypothetical protein [Pontibacter virosus]PVY44242.1 hypothetical protein C8E01_101608 [Pontibacter virosus]
MAFTSNITRYLTLPLMWVMLLWAFTLPGHELAVYSYLIKGSVAGIASGLPTATTEQNDSSVKKQTIQVFADATPVSGIMLSPQKAFRDFFSLFRLTPVEKDQPIRRQYLQVAVLLAHILPVSILRNAP